LLLVGVGVTIHLSFFDTIDNDTAKK